MCPNQKFDMRMLYLIYKTYTKKNEENAEKGMGAREEILTEKCSKEQNKNLLLCGFWMNSPWLGPASYL